MGSSGDDVLLAGPVAGGNIVLDTYRGDVLVAGLAVGGNVAVVIL